MKSSEFWQHFSDLAKPTLAKRGETFEQIFRYLDQFDRPLGIIETGCVREAGNWAGDGGSTILFDLYAKYHAGSRVYTVDLSAEATALCRQFVSPCVTIHTGDSVSYLQSLADQPPADLPFLDLLYLDSYDVDMIHPEPSAVHHLKELVAIAPLIRAQTLVVVDDAPTIMIGAGHNGNFELAGPPRIGGKGMYIAEYAEQVGATNLFTAYQCGWTNMRDR